MVIKHDLEPAPAQAGIIKTADHMLNLRPGGRERGGEISPEGTPEKVAGVAVTSTASI